MSETVIHIPRLLLAGFVAGLWVFVSGIAMAGVFGYREMSASFSAIGLEVPMGAVPFVVHTLVRLAFGMSGAVLFAISSRVFTPAQAMLVAASLGWVLGSLLPYVVVTEWGLFPWRLAWKILGWSAGEFLIAAWIVRLIYR